MILDLGGPPFYRPRRVVLTDYTLPDLLTEWLATRRWAREQVAHRLGNELDRLQSAAIVHGLHDREAARLYRERQQRVIEAIRSLTEPEAPWTAPPMPAAHHPFWRAARRAYEAEGTAPPAL